MSVPGKSLCHVRPCPAAPISKMNGIGNAIVVLDLRDIRHVVTPAEARAIAAHEPFDQLMALHAPARPAPTLSCESTTPTARNRAPAATARAASPGI